MSKFLQRRSETMSQKNAEQKALKLKYFRQTDQGNPRYFAEKTPSTVGLLCGQKTRPNGFLEPTPSEVAEAEKQSKAADTTSALLKKTFLKESGQIDDENE